MSVCNYTNLLELESNPPEGWTLELVQKQDYYTWYPEFRAEHRTLGVVIGNEDGDLEYRAKPGLTNVYELRREFQAAFPEWDNYQTFDPWDI